ncbi:MAG: T9SS type A sorting domain-containing protein, partial [Cytophagaceae bacterium]|nr:T9SS type A sorting domain-containing protein [Cytophagaceae bacterium]
SVTCTQNSCTSAASMATTVTVNPIPATPTVTAGGSTSFCSGGSVTLTASTCNGSYLWSPGNQTTQAITVSTSGSYSVTCTQNNCTSAASMATTVTVNPLPTAFSVTGGGSFCSGGSVTVGLSDSQSDVNYQLQRDGINVGTAVAGTGNALSFGNQTTAGSYTVVATNASTTCTAPMSGSASVGSTSTTPIAFTGTPTVSGVPVCAGSSITVNFSSTCPDERLRIELSNASGSFTTPTNLGLFLSNSSVLIPAATPAGSSYRVRVVAPSGTVTSNATAAFRIRSCTTSRLAAEVAEPASELQVSVSPNPTEGLLRISVRGAAGRALRLELFNGSGQVVWQQGVEAAQAEERLSWDIARQPPGLYLLRVSSDQQARTVKVLR